MALTLLVCGSLQAEQQLVWYPKDQREGQEVLSVTMNDGKAKVFINPKKTWQRYTTETVAYNGKVVVEKHYEVFARLEEKHAATKDGMRRFNTNAFVFTEFMARIDNQDLVIYSNGSGRYLVIVTSVKE